MTDRPILFNGAMVRAILDGKKTQTRRVMKPQPIDSSDYGAPSFGVFDDGGELRGAAIQMSASGVRCASSFCPFGGPVDRLWVRETWQYADWTEDGMPWIRYAADGARLLREHVTDEWAERVADTWAKLSEAKNFAIDGAAADRRCRPSIFMPRWASRITLDVTAVRVERLQAISAADAKAEGAPTLDDDPLRGAGSMVALSWYAELWDSINGKSTPWSSNPWVWVLEFSRAAGPKG